MQLKATIVHSLMLTLLAGSLISVQTARADDDGLGGPKVKDNSVPGNRGKLGDGSRERGEGRPQAPRAFVRAVESLKAESTPAELRLTAEQESKIKTLREEFEAKVQAYRDANKDEVIKLREDVGPRERRRIDEMLRGPGEGPRDGARREERPKGEPGDGMMDEGKPVDEAKAEAARKRLREIMEAAPQPTEVQTAVMGVLTEQQKEHVRTTMEKMAKERQEEMGGRGEGMLERLSPEDREKLKNMSPEERREFIREKMKERGEGEQGEGRRGRGKGGEKQPK
ncbi:MAG TPA: hypothetical protein VK157_13640 [Phycisphaerales bacterium]|nr:hypothetical protein [Phycisphaerales bacterium]